MVTSFASPRHPEASSRDGAGDGAVDLRQKASRSLQWTQSPAFPHDANVPDMAFSAAIPAYKTFVLTTTKMSYIADMNRWYKTDR